MHEIDSRNVAVELIKKFFLFEETQKRTQNHVDNDQIDIETNNF